MIFILIAHIPGNTPDVCLRNRSIGVSPPRLLSGRAANYGSIIIPSACHRLLLVAVQLSLHWLYRSLLGHGAPAGPAHRFLACSGNVSGGWLFSFQGSWSISLSNIHLGTFSPSSEKIFEPFSHIIPSALMKLQNKKAHTIPVSRQCVHKKEPRDNLGSSVFWLFSVTHLFSHVV